jgi:hypothetical protein
MIENKITKSGLKTIDAEEMLQSVDLDSVDIKQFLWQELVVKEKEFRQQITENKHVAVFSSVDAIIPHWAYMLIASCLGDAQQCYFIKPEHLQEAVVLNMIDDLKQEEFKGQRVIIKGCGNVDLSPAVYIRFTQKLKPAVKSLMFGEPCSTVPVYKKK